MENLEKLNIFAIPVGDFFSNPIEACSLVYSPLANIFFLALPAQINELERQAAANTPGKILEKLCNFIPYENRNPLAKGYDVSTTLYLLLNEKCNFKCKYCYSAEGRSNEELSIEQIYETLKFFLSNQRKAPNKRTVMFGGGGEPTLSWHLVEQATAFAEKTAAENNIELSLRLSTNGSILTPQMLDFYKTHCFELQCSFDVIPEVQDEQRGQFDKVDANLKTLGTEGIPCTIRATVTELNVDRMTEMIERCHSQYPHVTHLIYEHVIDPEYFTNTDTVQKFYGRYFHSFIEAQKLARTYHINLFSSSQGTMRIIRKQFCYSLYCLTPYGSLTTCPHISSPKEKGYAEAIFGKVDPNGVVFNDADYDRLTSGSIDTHPECKNCWARWNCGSGCPSQRRVYEPHIFKEICFFMKQMLRYNLIQELAEKHYKATGKNLFDDITAMLTKN